MYKGGIWGGEQKCSWGLLQGYIQQVLPICFQTYMMLVSQMYMVAVVCLSD